MNKKGIILASVGTGLLLFLVIFSIIVINHPRPLEVQGEIDATQVRVASKIVGRLDSLPVHKGDAVIKGQLLFTLKSPEIGAKLDQANAALLGAQAQTDLSLIHI